MFKKALLYLFAVLLVVPAHAQSKLRVFGYVIDTNNRGIELANVFFENTTVGTTTNINGYYELSTEVEDSVTIVFPCLGMKPSNILCTLPNLLCKYLLNCAPLHELTGFW